MAKALRSRRRSRRRVKRRSIKRSSRRMSRRRVKQSKKITQRRVKRSKKITQKRVKRNRRNSKRVVRGGAFEAPLNYDSSEADIDKEVSKIATNRDFIMEKMPQAATGFVAQYLGFVKKWKKHKQVDWLNQANQQIYLQRCIRFGNQDYPNLTILNSFEFALGQNLKENIHNLKRIFEKLQTYHGLKEKYPDLTASMISSNEIINEDILDSLIAELETVDRQKTNVQSGKEKLAAALAKKAEAREVVVEQIQLLSHDMKMETFRDYVDYLMNRGPIDLPADSSSHPKTPNIRKAEAALEIYIMNGGQIYDVQRYFREHPESPTS